MTTIGYDATTRTGRDALRSEICLSWDGGDPWGSVLSALGGVALATPPRRGTPDDPDHSPGLHRRDG